jgi:hypothetical protein
LFIVMHTAGRGDPSNWSRASLLSVCSHNAGNGKLIAKRWFACWHESDCHEEFSGHHATHQRDGRIHRPFGWHNPTVPISN